MQTFGLELQPITKMSYFWLRFLAILVSKLCYGLKYRKEFAFYV